MIKPKDEFAFVVLQSLFSGDFFVSGTGGASGGVRWRRGNVCDQPTFVHIHQPLPQPLEDSILGRLGAMGLRQPTKPVPIQTQDYENPSPIGWERAGASLDLA